MNTLVYLHGFVSSAKSVKAQLTQAWLAEHRPVQPVCIPELSCYPREAIAHIESIVDNCVKSGAEPVFVGSSLGGYYANYFAEQLGARAVLVNPAVQPYHLLTDYLGEQINPYTKVRYLLTQAHMAELKAIDVAHMREPGNRMVLLQTGDEVLDFRQAAAYYRNSQCHIVQGGDHSFQNFADWLPKIASFLGLG